MKIKKFVNSKDSRVVVFYTESLQLQEIRRRTFFFCIFLLPTISINFLCIISFFHLKTYKKPVIIGIRQRGESNMKISTKGRYALRMLLDLAQHQNDGFVPLKDIAERQNISKKYLEQIIPVFHKSDILQTSRGFQGGYRLAKSPDKYTVGEILRLTEGSLCPVACLEHEPIACAHSAECLTLPVWQGLYQVINTYLDGITLQNILDQQQERYSNDYVI